MIWHVKTGPKGIALTGRLARIVFTAAVGCVSAAAQDAKLFDASAYPAGVQKILQSARDECKAEGGGEVEFAAAVRTLDLTGGGRRVPRPRGRPLWHWRLRAQHCRDASRRGHAAGIRAPGLRNPVRQRRAHHSLYIAWRLLRRAQSVVHQDPPHYVTTVQVYHA